MEFAKKFTFLTLMLIAACFSASAQDRVLKFKLEHETHIANSTLPAGEYRLVMYDEPRPLAVISPEDRRATSVMVLATSYDFNTSCSASSVTLISDDQNWDLASVCFADAEEAFYFSVPARTKTTVSSATDTAALAGAR